MTNKKMGWLSGWKIIAEYCDVTVQTAKKYSVKKGLPVKKVGNKVFALPADLDGWLRTRTD